MAKTKRKETVVVFAGAGASKAVSSENYPTTVEFFEQLPTEITNDPLFLQVLGFHNRKTIVNTPVIDIEVLLWHLEELKSFLRNAHDKQSIIGWFVRGNVLGDAVGLKGQGFGKMANLVERGLSHVNRLVGNIHQQVYSLYGTEPDANRLRETWLPLLRPILDAEIRVELVTTNYDVVLETVVETLSVRPERS